MGHDHEHSLKELMRQAQEGDAEAYRVLLSSVQAIMKVYVRNTLRRMGLEDPALGEDLVQEVLIAIHEKRHTYDPSRLFTPWLFAIARYKLIDSGRKMRTQRAGRYAIPLEDIQDTMAEPVFSDPTAARDLEVLLGELPEKSRRVLELVKIEGLSVAETAAREEMSETAVKVTVHRAIKRLREQLSGGKVPSRL